MKDLPRVVKDSRNTRECAQVQSHVECSESVFTDFVRVSNNNTGSPKGSVVSAMHAETPSPGPFSKARDVMPKTAL